MDYYNIGPKERKFVVIDGDSARVIYEKDLMQQQQQIQDQIKIVKKLSDAELLAWARLNYPATMDTRAAEAELTRITTILDAIKGL